MWDLKGMEFPMVQHMKGIHTANPAHCIDSWGSRDTGANTHWVTALRPNSSILQAISLNNIRCVVYWLQRHLGDTSRSRPVIRENTIY